MEPASAREALELRVKDVDFERGQITIRQGKGRKDRVTVLPERLRATLRQHLDDVQTSISGISS